MDELNEIKKIIEENYKMINQSAQLMQDRFRFKQKLRTSQAENKNNLK